MPNVRSIETINIARQKNRGSSLYRSRWTRFNLVTAENPKTEEPWGINAASCDRSARLTASLSLSLSVGQLFPACGRKVSRGGRIRGQNRIVHEYRRLCSRVRECSADYLCQLVETRLLQRRVERLRTELKRTDRGHGNTASQPWTSFNLVSCLQIRVADFAGRKF